MDQANLRIAMHHSQSSKELAVKILQLPQTGLAIAQMRYLAGFGAVRTHVLQACIALISPSAVHAIAISASLAFLHGKLEFEFRAPIAHAYVAIGARLGRLGNAFRTNSNATSNARMHHPALLTDELIAQRARLIVFRTGSARFLTATATGVCATASKAADYIPAFLAILRGWFVAAEAEGFLADMAAEHLGTFYTRANAAYRTPHFAFLFVMFEAFSLPTNIAYLLWHAFIAADNIPSLAF
mmetsp:Transcript_27393/g.74886  ORF Transcript_27393/g.74886 Transcript_27393/m.74886 type:complete len:242 (+) Transcript_27393:2523-3248(+)